jgi:branched-chain amino acid transport system substrate-binding protein
VSRLLAALGAFTLAALLAAGCGRDKEVAEQRIIGDTVTVYSSTPQTGPLARVGRDLVLAEKLALFEAGGAAGEYEVAYVSLDASDARTGETSARRVAAAAREAIEDRQTVAYLGEVAPGASVTSLPLVNAAGMVQLTLLDTSAAISEPGAPGRPERLYPSGEPTLGRLVPDDREQARALAALARRRGARRVAIAGDGGAPSDDLAARVERELRAAGVRVVARERLGAGPGASPAAVARRVRAARPGALVYTGGRGPAGDDLLRTVRARAPRIALLASDRLALAPPRVRGLLLTAIAPPDGPEARAFAERFRARYGRAPHPYAVLGYDAMKVVLRAIDRAGPRADSRRTVRREALRLLGEPRGGFAAFRPGGGRLVRVGPAL